MIINQIWSFMSEIRNMTEKQLKSHLRFDRKWS